MLVQDSTLLPLAAVWSKLALICPIWLHRQIYIEKESKRGYSYPPITIVTRFFVIFRFLSYTHTTKPHRVIGGAWMLLSCH
jgi:hypothetical protein